MNSKVRLASAAVTMLAAAGIASAVAAAPAFAAAATVTQASATAQAANITVPGSTYQSSNPPTSATNDGSASTAPVVTKPGPLPSSALVGSTGPQVEVAQAGTDATSYACAGYGGFGFAMTSTCQVTPAVGTVIMLLNAIPVLGDALASTPCPVMQLRYKTISAHATAGPGSSSGDATVSGLTVLPCQTASQPPDCRTLVLSPSTDPNTDLLAAILDVMSAEPGCAPMVAALQGVQNQIEFQFNHQTTAADGTLRVDGLHFATLSGTAAGFDLASVTVGPNSTQVIDTPMINPETVGWLAAALVIGALAVFAVRHRRTSDQT